MTDDRRPTDDPTRALDGVNPPDQWADITSRATGPVTVAPLGSREHGRTRRPYALVAAAVLVVSAVVGGLVLAERGKDDSGTLVTGAPDPDFDDPSAVLGRRWILTQFQRGGETLDLHGADRSPTLVLDLTIGGEASFRRCNGGPASLTLEGDRLVVGIEWMSTTFPCPGPEGEALMRFDDALAAFLSNGPVVELTGDRLVLRSGTAEAHFEEAIGQPVADPDDADPSPPSIPSADDGEDIDLRGWYGNTGPMVLAAVEVDGVVTPAVDTPFGGGMADTDGGPIALMARADEGGLDLRGCEIEPLSLGESEGRPTVGLPGGSFSNDGCSPAAGDQWGQVLKILSLGPVTRTVETGDGPMLLLSTEEGTALFHRFPPR